MKRYVIEEREDGGKVCDGCVFDGDLHPCHDSKFIKSCSKSLREDGKSIIFALVKTEEIEADKCQKS